MQKLGFPEIPAHYMQAATEMLKEKIQAKTSLILSNTDLSYEDKMEIIDHMFDCYTIGKELSVFLHAAEYGSVVFDNDRKDEPNFQD
ncbi:hypothetical protein [Acetobacter senegalensis]|uniref:hypothetical protein n=1 Tax=Acetobacter senegalensis TaxID=446692 RepID=UPI001EDADB2E|nr:hypothetical protein [Acetobacter senegalensis]MCG4258040.1 hypothetical protein [Acetobacter senegalensis]MCG4267967.1 hypothetical protein [Acetobacter senegalensis]